MKKRKTDIDFFIDDCVKKSGSPEVPSNITFEDYDHLTHHAVYDMPVPVRHLVIEEAKIDNYLVTLSSLETQTRDQKFIHLCHVVRRDLYNKRSAVYKKEIELLTTVLRNNNDLVPYAQLVLLNNWRFTYTLTDISAYDQNCRLILCNFF